ncbi:hypothetical protein Tsubulata_020626, partial [Turnera subulata]
VNPALFGDHKVRTVAYWSTSNGVQGCYNLLCPGFVLTSHTHTVGAELLATSVYGSYQIALELLIYRFFFLIYIIQDPKTGDWWVQEDNLIGGKVTIGYWPNQLFGSLNTVATMVEFGGLAYSPPNVPPPTMGSGHFEPPSFLHTSFVANVRFLDSSGYYTWEPVDVPFVDQSDKCYESKFLGNTGGHTGFASMFGGPGGASCM